VILFLFFDVLSAFVTADSEERNFPIVNSRYNCISGKITEGDEKLQFYFLINKCNAHYHLFTLLHAHNTHFAKLAMMMIMMMEQTNEPRANKKKDGKIAFRYNNNNCSAE
jgi:hypothetical protein